MKLANIYENSENKKDKERGEDLRYRPQSMRKLPNGKIQVDVPLVLAGIKRADPHQEGTKIILNEIPKQHAENAVIRLRGFGGKSEDKNGIAGDLYLDLSATATSDIPSLFISALSIIIGSIMLVTVLYLFFSRKY